MRISTSSHSLTVALHRLCTLCVIYFILVCIDFSQSPLNLVVIHSTLTSSFALLIMNTPFFQFLEECRSWREQLRDMFPLYRGLQHELCQIRKFFQYPSPLFDVNDLNPNAKYIIVMRNTRDVCLSYYYHATNTIHGAHGKLFFNKYCSEVI